GTRRPLLLPSLGRGREQRRQRHDEQQAVNGWRRRRPLPHDNSAVTGDRLVRQTHPEQRNSRAGLETTNPPSRTPLPFPRGDRHPPPDVQSSQLSGSENQATKVSSNCPSRSHALR